MLARRHVDDHELVRDPLFRQSDEDPTRESREWIVVQLDSHETFPQEVAYQVAKYLGCAGSQSLLRLAVRAPEPRFKFADGVAERRLRDAELSCRLGEAVLAPDRRTGRLDV